jgi:hypothetical protein
MKGTRTFDRLPSWRMANLHFGAEERRGWNRGRRVAMRRFPGKHWEEGIARICLFDCFSRRGLSGIFSGPQEDCPETSRLLLIFHSMQPMFFELLPSLTISRNSPNPSLALPFRNHHQYVQQSFPPCHPSRTPQTVGPTNLRNREG